MNYAQMPEVPPIEAYEIGADLEATFSDAAQVAPILDTVTNPFWRIEASSDWIEAQIPRRQWLVPGYLMKAKVSASIGAPEAGKSTVALKQAISLALDVPFGDYKPVPLPGETRRPRRVLILNAEDDEDEQRRRISALIRETGRRVADLGDNLIRIRPSGETAKLFEPGMGAGEVYPTEALANLKTTITELCIDVLILDPLVELMGGADENSNAVMGSVFASLRSLAEECGIAILVIHHIRKGELKPGSLEAARGGGALGGSVRCAHTVAVMSETDADALGIPKDTRKHYVRIDNAKQSYAPPADGATWLQRFSIDLDNGESAPGLVPWEAPKAREMSLDELAPIEAAVKAGIGGEPYSPKLSSNDRSVRSALKAHGFIGNATEAAILSALQEKCGMVEADYHRRNEKGQRRGIGRGLRIGGLPAVEWVTTSGATGSPTSGSENDDD